MEPFLRTQKYNKSQYKQINYLKINALIIQIGYNILYPKWIILDENR